MSNWKCLSKSINYQIWGSSEHIDNREIREYRSNDKSLKYLTPRNGPGDVVEDVYEGGHQVWQGTLIAISYFANNNSLKPRRILDLGCGNGFFGIYFLKYSDVEKVVFQDLNEDVLTGTTIKNLELNDIDPSRFETISGFWPKCFENYDPHSFDLILTSDTVYRIKNYDNLLSIFDRLLSRDNESRVFICGKDFYFGNDGGMLQFGEFIDSKPSFTKQIALRDEGNVTHTLIELKRS